ncbi:Secreted lipase [Pseudocercospora fuligena]|uniref:Carboxylic ester hydrolase n=1 Tax=Pseudocercospora fuligena TaxID=685502 RepID=A0A8H6VGI9_9PEZI|nr:Secreted lipase [Pseudocercospora fuligena]
MRERIISLLLITGLACANDRPTAEACNGVTFLGFYANENEAFVGIRYGKDTGGQNRFKPPQMYHYGRNETVHATEPGPMCPQPLGGFEQPIVHDYSEDCLRLNIMRPNGTTAESRLPVMVFLYGGSFFFGSKDDFASEAGGMILQSVANGHPIMHVRINYRLGIFGFAQSEALRKEGSENAGLRDQRLALEWIKDNIEAFGGDPSKVTISGQSSGGVAVGMQIVAYGGTRPAPFQRGICQSQLLEQGVSANFTQNAMKRTLNATICNQTDIQSVETVACLRNLSAHDLFEATNATWLDTPEANLGDEWLPSVDGDFVPALPSELVNSGRFNNVSMIIGWTDDD